MLTLKVRCPKNPKHDRFTATAHVTQTWEVDERGNFIKEISTDDTTHSPDKDDIWYCKKCGARAIVEEVSEQ